MAALNQFSWDFVWKAKNVLKQNWDINNRYMLLHCEISSSKTFLGCWLTKKKKFDHFDNTWGTTVSDIHIDNFKINYILSFFSLDKKKDWQNAVFSLYGDSP